ncbi:hypothetical protein [Bacillus sp. AG4(2022)]|uniref:hypothetical protein n=1 Tax=Bacillus sp. AG4(2022) TaxID=2962594 RepID=UPI0028819D8C|nr:hypothetical protein [Bacillus sp. AG4(2022)]MDT0160276.1 hypothetical protein [Bacillus sp. AG4(2022)]
MSDYFQTFKDLVNQKQFQSDNSLMDRNKEVFADNFDTSPLSTTITVNDVNTVAMIRQEKDSNKKKLIFRPDTKIDIGSVIRINSSYYLTLDFLSEGINEVYPTAKVQLCNSTLPIQSGKTRVLKRNSKGEVMYNDLTGEPLTEWIEGKTELIPCIVESSYRVNENNDQIWLPEGEISITLPYHSELQLGYEFNMYGAKYKVLNFDMSKVINGIGILTLRAKMEV